MAPKHEETLPSSSAAANVYKAAHHSKKYLIETLGVDLVNNIAGGGQGNIYTNPVGHGTPRIVKVFDKHEGFTAEMDILDVLPRHPGIVRLLGYSTEAGFNAVVLEKLSGPNLKEIILDFGWMDTIKILKQIAEALQHVHRCGFVHADVKPKNIVFHEGQPKLVDFGASLEVGKRPQRSTPKWVAPEGLRLGAHPATAKYDTFSYGVIALQLLMKERSPGDRDPAKAKAKRQAKAKGKSAQAKGKGKSAQAKGKGVAKEHITEVAQKRRGDASNPLIHVELRRSREFEEKDGAKLLDRVFDCVAHGVGSRPTMEAMVTLLEGILKKISKMKEKNA